MSDDGNKEDAERERWAAVAANAFGAAIVLLIILVMN